MSEVKTLVVVGAVGLAVAFGWYKYWVEPRDAFVAQILECTDGDRSRAAYDRCIETIKKK